MYYVYTQVYAGANPQQNLNGDTVHISTVAVRTNSSKEVITQGWAGTSGDWSVFAYGEFATLDEAKAYVEQEFETREVPYEQEEDHQGAEGDVEVRLLGRYQHMGNDELADWIDPALDEIEAGTTDEQIEMLVKELLDDCQSEHGTTFCEARAVEYCEERREDLQYEQEKELGFWVDVTDKQGNTVFCKLVLPIGTCFDDRRLNSIGIGRDNIGDQVEEQEVDLQKLLDAYKEFHKEVLFKPLYERTGSDLLETGFFLGVPSLSIIGRYAIVYDALLELMVMQDLGKQEYTVTVSFQ